MTARDRILDLMCMKVGFFPRVEIDAQVLKYIVAAFPYIIRNKGNVTGIQYAVNAILKAESHPDSIGIPRVVVNNKNDTGPLAPYTVYIYTTVSLYNKKALEEVLRYVMPTGYMYQILAYIDSMDDSIEQFKQSDNVKLIAANIAYTSSVVSNSEFNKPYDPDSINMLRNLIDTTEVVPITDIVFDTSADNSIILDNKEDNDSALEIVY